MVTLPVRLLVWGLLRWLPWLLLLGWGGLVLAQGVAPLPARAVVNPTVAPAAVKLNVATKVRIYADIGDPNVIAAGVNLLKVGAAGTNPTIVGVLKDDGTGGDEIAGDGRFSIELTVNEPAAKTLVYRISAPFKGTLLRTVTADLPLAVVANRPPVAVPGADQVVRVGGAVLLDGRGSYDLDGERLSFRWTLLPPAGSAATLDSASYVQPGFTPDLAGVYRVQLVVNDGQVDSAVQELTVTAVAGNAAPTARLAAIVQPFGPGPTASVPLSGAGSSDPEGSPLSYAWALKAVPATSRNASVSPTSGPTPQLLADQPGRYLIELTVHDGTQPSVPTQAWVTLYRPNTPPTVSAGPDQGGQPTGSAVKLQGTASDADGDQLTAVQWRFIAVPAGSSAASLANATGLTPGLTPDRAGDYLIELTATDSRGASRSARVVVRAIVLPPVTIASLIANPGSGTVPLTVAFQSQAAGGTGTYTYGWTFGDSTSGSGANPSHTYTQPGSYPATVTATDGQGKSAQQSVTIVANPVVIVTNQAPQVNAGPTQTITLPALVNLAGSATDDGLPNPPAQLTYLWSLDSGPAAPALTEPTLPATTALFPTPGTYVLKLTADDGALKGSATVTITVSDSGPRLAAIADRTIPLGTRFQLQLAADDGNPTDRLTYSLLAGPTGAALNPSPRLDWLASQLGTHTFAVRVTDAFGHSDDKSFTVTVIPANRAPVLAAQADATLPRGATFSRTLSATDPDGGNLTFGLDRGPPGMTLTGALLSWPTAASTPGSYPVTVRVTDAAGAFAVQRFTVTLTPSAPPVANDDHYEVQLGQVLTVPAAGVLANDVDPMAGSLTAANLTAPDKGSLTAFHPDGSFAYQAPPTIGKTFQPVVKWTSIAPAGDGSTALSNLVAVDVDGDGKPEIFSNRPATAAWGDRGISAIHGSDGTLLWGSQELWMPPVANGGPAPLYCTIETRSNQPDAMAVGDIDDSGHPAIVVPLQCPGGPNIWPTTPAPPSARLAAFDARTGALKWISEDLGYLHDGYTTYYNGMMVYIVPAIARLRAGETPTVLFKKRMSGTWNSALPGESFCNDFKPGTGDSCTVVVGVDGANGHKRQTWVAPIDVGNEDTRGGYVIVADATGSGAPNIIADGAVWNLDGTLVSHRMSGRYVQGLAVANLDDSGQLAIISHECGQDCPVVARKPDGTVMWETPTDPTGVSVSGEVVVADLFGDGRPKVLVTTNGNLYAFDERGAIVWTHRFARPDNTPTIGQYVRPVVFDLDGDGVPEVIVQTQYDIQFFDGKTGKLKSRLTYADIGYPADHSWDSRLTPIVIDADGDGHAEVVFNLVAPYYPLRGWIVALTAAPGTTAWQPARPVSNQFAMHDANVTDTGHIPFPEANNFATPRTNVFANPARIGNTVDPRRREQARFTYKATAAGLDSNPATVTIDILPPNRPPVFTSTPPTTYMPYGASGPGNPYVPFVYYAHASDPDPGDTLTYAIVAHGGPEAASIRIDAASGKVDVQGGYLYGSHYGSWGPASTIVIAATDSFGESAYQTVMIVPSDGPVAVPNVVGRTKAEASAALQAAGFVVGTVTEVANAAPVGQVIAQFPAAGASVLKGEGVALTVSKGPEPVAVPLVVGQPYPVATTALAAAGFTVVRQTVFSNSAAAGEVLAQSVAAGTLLSPTAANPVTLTVAAGNGLRLTVNRSVVTADQAITVTPAAFDASGNPAALPALSYAITAVLTPYAGSLPTLSGQTITAGLGTQGAFRVTATDAAGGRSASADFVVAPAPAAGEVTHAQAFAQLVSTLDAIFALKPALVAARAANDGPQMKAVLAQMVTLWRTVDLDDLKLSMPLVAPDRFVPTLAELRTMNPGVQPTADDLLVNAALHDAAEDIRAWTTALRSTGMSIPQLNALADQFSTRAARLDGLTVSEYGGLSSQRQYTQLLSHRIPAFYDALFDELAVIAGLPARTPALPNLKRRTTRATLAEQLTTIAVDYVVEKIMEEGSKTLKNAKQLARDVLGQAVWSAAAVGIARHLKEYVSGGEIDMVISGASLSFREFNEPPNQAIIEVPGDFDDPELTAVMIVGPDTVGDVVNGVKDLYQKMKEGFSYGLDAAKNIKRYKSFDQAKKDMQAFMKKLKDIKKSVTNLTEVIDNAYQTADDVLPGCIFTSDPSCAQLIYNDGIKPVYRYTAPPGLTSLSGLPVPIVFIVQNQYTGLMYFGTPAFFPAPKKP